MTRLCLVHGGDVSTPSGGTDRISALAAGLQRRDNQVTVVVPELAGDPPDRLSAVDIREVSVPDRIENTVSRALAVAEKGKRIAAAEDARLQVEHSVLGGLTTLSGTPSFVLDMHDLAYARYDHVDGWQSAAMRRGVGWLERRAVERADAIVVVSEYMKRHLIEEWDVLPSKVSVIPNGYFPEKVETWRSDAPVEGRVGFLGTLHPKVDADAITDICELAPVSEVVVVGDGAQRDRFEELSDRYPELIVTGRLPDDEAFERIGRAEVVVNPQHSSDLQRSSSPVKLYYYAALGQPIVASAGPPLVERLVEADAALAPDGRQAFVDAVRRVLTDTELSRRLGENAREQARTFQWDRRVETLREIYE